ncbi:hypothetical protein FQN51_001182 [Onygenales sp. PD_10]|nr:hypothetical protein FQN51_001182 [Onygenales sp. PD_10]
MYGWKTYGLSIGKGKSIQRRNGNGRAVFPDPDVRRHFAAKFLVDVSRIVRFPNLVRQGDPNEDSILRRSVDVYRDTHVVAAIEPLRFVRDLAMFGTEMEADNGLDVGLARNKIRPKLLLFLGIV